MATRVTTVIQVLIELESVIRQGQGVSHLNPIWYML